MSDSDDTDVLLLIPPDFFNIETASVGPVPRRSGGSVSYISEVPRSSDLLSSFGSTLVSNNNGSYKSSLVTMSTQQGGLYPGVSGTSYDYQSQTDGTNVFYSTPLKGHLGNVSKSSGGNNHYLLSEIDQFFQVGSKKQPSNQVRLDRSESNHSPVNSLIDINNVSLSEFPSLTTSDFNTLNRTTVPQKPPRKDAPASIGSRLSMNTRTPLLSLHEIWNNNAINQESSKVQEERMRRQHLERNIHMLQAKLLEYEQKIAVAIDVDKEKEGMILRLEQESVNLNQHIRDLEHKHNEQHEKLLQENVDIKNKNLHLEKELGETIVVARKLQDRNETLESKVESLTTANQDVTDVHKNQLKDLEIRLSNSRESERNLKEQCSRLKKSNEQMKDELEVERKKSEETNKLRADLASLKVKVDNLNRKLADANTQNDSFKEQIKDLKAQNDTHLEEKKNLLKELDVQRLSLKKYYQSQLEDVVADKLREFQKQLTAVEEQLRSEAKRKERLLAERAIKQIELINQTNEQEIKLLNEKYNEQEALYRLQLTNSSKTIHDLEDKLACYQNRRANIAEQLHSIMEIQWQKALEVLTSPSPVAVTEANSRDVQSRFSKLCVDHIDKDQLDGVRTLKSVAENETFQTPVSSRQQRLTGNPDGRNTLPRDLLHNYIELLLEKSPNDLKDLENLLSGCKKDAAQCAEKSSVPPGAVKHGAEPCLNTNLSQLSKTLGKTPKPWR
ncbi:myosin heavy chain, non-muscle [Topomyia yanbarensis]|uniref:myosin heavy chain, non-muscle n=1 Tax=Topomyia yanbarensis TaxID=2498891 RepID=UPI00273BD045|nr:myosin heavy chain, non-muscle [Topomyia yanbarensis]XP_058824282.1 myosin heavy chain, non-muscle [Topomyia yanbarensis]